MFFRFPEKLHPKRSRRIQDASKTTPRRPTTLPRRFQDASKTPQDVQDAPKTFPRRPQDAPERFQDAPRRAKKCKRRSQDASKPFPRDPKTRLAPKIRLLGWILRSWSFLSAGFYEPGTSQIHCGIEAALRLECQLRRYS